ncbi:histidinol-phosphatase [Marinicauda algicola]|uniref:Histidinol-phosphatase n=1 Tax=Marinicauda algicola TaxID=2029849 RepID=A0A4V3RYG8_9PROT|nr:histidinol-phosphatase [Marinicauda algicola]TGY90339.1 histidinol-phosphatase [Marinicauda algicola]
MSPIRPEDDLAFAARLADAAREVVYPLFRAGLAADNKDAAGFDPVTEADRAIEARLRTLIAERFPEDGVLGEEEGARPSTSGRTWVLDPIDGTRAFIAGIPTWTVLIGLADDTGPGLSVIDQPHTGERFLGVALGTDRRTMLEHAGRTRALRASSVKRLRDAVLTTTDPYLFEAGEAEAFARLRPRVRLARYGLDAYGYAMLALGGVDLVVESGLKPWDVAALVPVIRGAGGVVTDWAGRARIETGQVLAAATPALHEEALALLEACAL